MQQLIIFQIEWAIKYGESSITEIPLQQDYQLDGEFVISQRKITYFLALVQLEMPTSKIVNSCSAELFVNIFHSFEAGIAIAISSLKWIKNNIIFET